MAEGGWAERWGGGRSVAIEGRSARDCCKLADTCFQMFAVLSFAGRSRKDCGGAERWGGAGTNDTETRISRSYATATMILNMLVRNLRRMICGLCFLEKEADFFPCQPYYPTAFGILYFKKTVGVTQLNGESFFITKKINAR